jgi:predicted  nucleic acid-binding Zn-ribbon protein
MFPILEKLLVVQDRDTRIGRLKAEAARIPGEIAAVEARVKTESAKLESARNQLKHLEAERKKLEVDAETKRGQIHKYRGQLSLIKSNTEYQALLKEIAHLEDAVKEVEDRELELMAQVEQLQPQLREEQQLLQDLTARAAAEKAELQNRAELIQRELSQLQAERAGLVKDIDADALARYERLLRSKGDAVVVPIQHGNCGGCHLHLAPQVVHNARHDDGLTSCDYCGRILYWQPE